MAFSDVNTVSVAQNGTTAVTYTGVSGLTFADYIAIENPGTISVWARADGGTAVASAAGTIQIYAGSRTVITNQNVQPNSNLGKNQATVLYYNGYAYSITGSVTGAVNNGPASDQSGSYAWTAQQGFINSGLYGSLTAHNQVSIVSAAANTAVITVTFL